MAVEIGKLYLPVVIFYKKLLFAKKEQFFYNLNKILRNSPL